MECLNGLVGYKGDCEEIKGDLYLNDLQGFLKIVASESRSAEYLQGIDLIKSKIALAQSLMGSMIRASLVNTIRQANIIDHDVVGYYVEGLTAKTNGYLKGVRLKMQGTKYMELIVNSVSFIAKEDKAQISIIIADLRTGKILKEVEIQDVKANELVSVSLNDVFKCFNSYVDIFIGTYSDSVDVQKTNLKNGNGGCSSCDYSNAYVTATATKFDINFLITGLYGNLAERNIDTNGISVDYSIGCSVDAFICSLRNTLAMPLLYKTASEIMKEAMYSRRLNSIVIVDKTLNAQLQADFENQYVSSLQGIIENIKTPNDVCFNCIPKVRKIVQIP